MNAGSSQNLKAQVEQACAQLQSLQEKLSQEKIDLEIVQQSLQELEATVNNFFSQEQPLTLEEKRVVTRYLTRLQALVKEVEVLRDEAGAQLGQLRRGRKVSSAYNQNT